MELALLALFLLVGLTAFAVEPATVAAATEAPGDDNDTPDPDGTPDAAVDQDDDPTGGLESPEEEGVDLDLYDEPDQSPDTEEDKAEEEIVAEEAAQKEEKPAEDEGLDAELLDRAKDAGLSEDMAKTLGTSSLDEFLAGHDKELGQLGRQILQSRTQQPAAPQAPAQPAAPAQPTPAVAPTPPTPAPTTAQVAYKCGLDPDDISPEVVEEFGKLHTAFNTRVTELETGVQTFLSNMANAANARTADQFTTDFDKQLAGLGDEYEPLFGKGNIESLDKQSEAFKHRARLAEEVTALQVVHDQMRRQGQTDRNPPGFARCFKSALRSLHGDDIDKKVETKTREKISKSLDKRSGQVIARPSQRAAPVTKQSATQRTEAKLDAKMKEWGHVPEG